MMPVDGGPVCAAPEWLPVVDAAFKKGGTDAAAYLKRYACARCPVFAECLFEALQGPEHGPWGGTTAKERTSKGGRSASRCINLADVRKGKGPRFQEVSGDRAS
jgi:hypothetical protein